MVANGQTGLIHCALERHAPMEIHLDGQQFQVHVCVIRKRALPDSACESALAHTNILLPFILEF